MIKKNNARLFFTFPNLWVSVSATHDGIYCHVSDHRLKATFSDALWDTWSGLCTAVLLHKAEGRQVGAHTSQPEASCACITSQLIPGLNKTTLWLIGEIFITGSGSRKERDAVNKLAGSPRGKSHALAHAAQRRSTDTGAALLPWRATEAVAVVSRFSLCPPVTPTHFSPQRPV